MYIWKAFSEYHEPEKQDDSLTDQETESLSVSSAEPLTKKQLKEIRKREKELQKREKQEEKARKKQGKEQLKKIAKNEPESFEAHKDTVISVVLAPIESRRLLAMDGVLVVSADETGCVRIWTCSSPTDSEQSSSSEKSH